MNAIYVIIGAVFGIIIIIGLGLELSKNINLTVIYILFWLLYGITILTFVIIVGYVYFYYMMKNKQGPPGPVGPQGDKGLDGNVGKCDPSCKDNICVNEIVDSITKKLQDLNNGTPVTLNNVYIKSKIKQMCGSDEFKGTAPYKNPTDLINYLKDIWNTWVTLIYNAGGKVYFQSIGGDMEWEWKSNNPFDEIKKYDVFYWGMSSEYRPQIIDQCLSNVGVQSSVIKLCTTNLFDPITNDDGLNSTAKASFWRPRQLTYQTINFYPLGDIVVGPTRQGENTLQDGKMGAITLPQKIRGPVRETLLIGGDVLGPIDYNLIWTNSGFSGNQFWVWRPIGPNTSNGEYLALGDVITTTPEPPATGENAPIRCVPRSILTQLNPNGNVLWSSLGSQVNLNLLMVGYNLNNGVYQIAKHENAYNLFRGIIGMNSNIPSTDVNASFYKINLDLDINQMPGGNNFTTGVVLSNASGSGYISSPVKDSKYSVLAYLNMKENINLRHNMTRAILTANIIPNAIGLVYTINYNNLCIKNVNSEIILSTCDNTESNQQFNIELTGNGNNQCRIKTIGGNPMYVIIDQTAIVRLVNTITNRDTNQDMSLFTML